MTAAKNFPARIEEHCPACGAVFAPSLGASRKKVQCPKCRKIVVLKPAAPVVLAASSPEPAAAELAELRARLRELEALAGRVEFLEKQIEWLMDHRPAAEAALLRPGQKLRWLRGDHAPWNGEGEPIPAVQGELLLHNLRALPSGALAITIAADDPPARRLGERLRDIFHQAAWSVGELREKILPPRKQGLALFASVCPPPQSLTAAAMALTAAGFPLCSCVDDRLGPNEVVLAVGH